MLGDHRHASETPKMASRWRADDGRLYSDHLSPHKKKEKKKEKKTLSELDPLWQNFLDPRMKN